MNAEHIPAGNIPDGIAVIGMACRFPGAEDKDIFWENLKNGVESITEFTDQDLEASGIPREIYNQPAYVRKGFVIADEDKFDAAFFGYSPREAKGMDPQHRLFLETAWKALEDGGYPPGETRGAVGMFAGSKISTYLLNLLDDRTSLHGGAAGYGTLIGNDKDYLVTRASYKLNLKGPSVAVQCACSTSLVAVHFACESVLSGECDMALAGGVAVAAPQKTGYLFQEGMVLSPDGHCRAFDEQARGMMPGNGVGVVVLKDLEKALRDKDHIYAVVRGTAMNNDGADKTGYTAPSVEGQTKVIREAISVAGVDCGSISYVETHGTGTELGDPIEIESISDVFRTQTDKKGFCAIGSVKTNIGHLDTAAGIASFIKTVLSLQHAQVPPSLNFSNPNPKIDFHATPFFVNTALSEWKTNGSPRRAGVSSFGFGGTNAHAILEQAPEPGFAAQKTAHPLHLLTLSAKTADALAQQIQNFHSFLKDNAPAIGDVCFTANTGRSHFQYRFAAIAATIEELRNHLSAALQWADSHTLFKGEADDLMVPQVSFDLSGTYHERDRLETLRADTHVLESGYRLPVPGSEKKDCRLILSVLGKLYVRGATIDWEGFYPDGTPCRIPLPTYPFERKRHWQEAHSRTADAVPFVSGSGNTPMPFKGQQVACAAPVFQFVVSLSACPFLEGHRIHGKTVVPVGAFWEMALAAGKTYFDSGPLLLKHMTLQKPMVIPGDQPAPALQIVLEPEGPGIQGAGFTIFCKEESPESQGNAWETIGSGEMAIENRAEAPISFEQIRNRCGHAYDVARFSADLYALDGITGEADECPWQFRELWTSECEALAKVVFSKPFLSEAGECTLHPSIFEPCLHTLFAVPLGQEDDSIKDNIFLPVGFDTIAYTAPLSEEMWCHVSVQSGKNWRDADFIVDFQLLTQQGKAAARMLGAHMRQAPAGAFLRGAAPFPCYRIQWQPLDTQTGSRPNAKGCWLVLGDQGGVAEKLVQQIQADGNDWAMLHPNGNLHIHGNGIEHQEKITADEMSVRETFEHIFTETLPGHGLDCTGVVQCWGMDAPMSEEMAAGEIGETVFSAWSTSVNLVRAVVSSGRDIGDFCILTQDARAVTENDGTGLAQTPLWAMQKCLEKEHPELNIHIFDLERSGGGGQISSLWEMLRSGSNEREAAFRNGRPYVPRLVPAGSSHGSPQQPDTDPGVDGDGTYLITGGFGGVGMETAGWLVAHGVRHLVLLGRSAPNSGALEQIRELQAKGVRVLGKRADVNDVEALSTALSHVRDAMPPIKGVFHLAGIMGEGMVGILGEGSILHQDLAYTREILAPKVEGAWNLHRITREDPLDHFVLFSSVSSLWGGHGLSAYSGANSFLDALAHYRREMGLPATSINWGPFSRVGMVAGDEKGAELREKFGLSAFDPVTALAHFARVRQFAQACICEMDWDRFFTHSDMRDDPLFAMLSNRSGPTGAALEKRSGFLTQLASLSDDKRHEMLTTYLKQKVAAALGIDEKEISARDNLLQMGMDSLIFLSLAQTISSDLHIKVVPHKLFEDPTIDGLLNQFAGDMALEAPGEAGNPAEQFRITDDPANRHEPFPLTDIQHAYWVGRSGVIQLGDVACHAYFEIAAKDLDLSRYTAAWQRAIDRHEMLRAIVLPDGRQQVLESVPPFEIEVTDLRKASAGDMARHTALIRDEMSHQVTPEDQWPLFEVRAVIQDDRQLLLHISIDILIADGYSIYNLMQEIDQYYQAPGRVDGPIPCTFRDYVLAENKYRESALYQASRQYWMDRLPTLPPAPELPLAKTPAELEQTRFKRRETRLAPHTWEKLQSRAARAGLTQANLLLAAYAEVLGTWSKTPQFTLNLTFFNRLQGHARINEVIGDFTSLVLLAVDIGHDLPFDDRARRLQKQLWKDMEYRYFSGVRVLQELSRGKQERDRTLMPVVFTSNLGYEAIRQESSGLALPGKLVYSISQTPQVWIDNQVSEDEGGLLIVWDAVDGLFPEGMLNDMFQAYQSLLARLAESDDAWHDTAFDLLPDSQAAMREAYNATQAPELNPEPGQLLHTLFFDQAERHPDKAALVTSEMRMSYKEVALLAGQVGRHLRSGGVRPNEMVAVAMDKGWEQVPAVLGILASGAAYLPIDASVPGERLRHLIEDGKVRHVITQSWLAPALEWPEGVQCLSLDTFTPINGDERVVETDAVQTPEDLAYVIHTSGSTGLPKGVMIDHKGAVNTILDVNTRFNVTSGDTVFALSNLNFDLSVYDVFGTLAAGGTIVMPDDALKKDPSHWLALMRQENVTVWNSVPALMQMLVEHLSGSNEPAPDALRLVLMSGDWIPLELPEKIRSLCGQAEIISLGGATEASIWSILHPINQVEAGWKSIPYGRPMANQQFYVFNKNFQPSPDWVTGDLYIGGIGLAKGYLGDEEKTDASFIRHPVSGIPLYRTGDMGRMMPQGDIEFLGREDQQVKISGYRIELGEIEAVLGNHPMVREAVVSVLDNGDGKQQLVGYVVPAKEAGCAGEPQAPAPGEAPSSVVEAIHGQEGVELTDPVARTEFKIARKGIRQNLNSAGITSFPRSETDKDMIDAYSRRISYRRFDREPVPFEQFAGFMETLRSIRIPEYPFPRYRYGSAGGLYPVQVYVWAKPQGIDSLSPGISYYHPEHHQLVLLAPDTDIPSSVFKGNEDIFEEAAFAIFLVADRSAIDPLYGANAKPYCLMEAGIISQLLESASFSHGIGLCQIGGLDFSDIRRLFQLDAGHEYLHCLVGGKISQASGWTLLDAVAQSIPSHKREISICHDNRLNCIQMNTIRTWMANILPDYMVPRQIMTLGHIPLNANGKVNRRELPVPMLEKKEIRTPQTPLEKEVAGIWRQVLSIDEIGMDDHFFELGGDSLVAVKLVNQLRGRFDVTLSLKRLIEKPTIAHVTRFIEEAIPAENQPISEYKEGSI